MNGNPNFQFQVNLAGVDPATGASRQLPEGVYKARIQDVYHRQASTGRDMIEFKVEITEPGFEGILRTFRINVPTSPNDNVRHYWRAAFESVGYTAAQIDGAGNIQVSRAAFFNPDGSGKDCYIHYTLRDEVDDQGRQRDTTNLIPPAVYHAEKKAQAAAKAASGSALGSGNQGNALANALAPAVANMQAQQNAGGGGLGGGLQATQPAQQAPVQLGQQPAGGLGQQPAQQPGNNGAGGALSASQLVSMLQGQGQ